MVDEVEFDLKIDPSSIPFEIMDEGYGKLVL